MLVQLWPQRERIAAGRNDFLGIWAGAVLAGSGRLYDAAAARQVLEERTGMSGEAMQFVRPPFYAALLYPLGRLPYRAAYALWELMSLAAVAGFLALWPGPGREWLGVAAAWSVPLWMAVANGQDVPMLLLAVALAARWAEKYPARAGAALALCAVKFHLFALAALVPVLGRRWRMLAGAAAVVAALAGLGFAAAGAAWPVELMRAATAGRVNPRPDLMVSLYGMVARFGLSVWVAAALSAVAVVCTVVILRRERVEMGLALALMGGVLIGGHAWVHDAALLLPALVGAAVRLRNWVGSAAILLLTPLPYAWLLGGSVLAIVIQAGCLAVLAAMAYQGATVRTKTTATRSR